MRRMLVPATVDSDQSHEEGLKGEAVSEQKLRFGDRIFESTGPILASAWR